jgi:hypothetical protein
MYHESLFPMRVSIQRGDQCLERMRKHAVAAGHRGAQLTADEVAGVRPVVTPPLIQDGDRWPLSPEGLRVSGRTVNRHKPVYEHAPTGIARSAWRSVPALYQLDLETGYRRTFDLVDEFDRGKI